MKRGIAVMILILLVGGTLSAQTVVNRIRLGSSVEDAIYINSGVYAGQFAYLDGLNVMGVPANAKPSVQLQILFDTTRVPIFWGAPRGFSYIPDTNEFVFTDNLDPYDLYFSDMHGVFTRTISVQWPDAYQPTNAEAIRWIPETDITFPGKFLIVANDANNGYGYIGVMDQFGNIAHVIVPSPPVSYITALAYLSPNRLVIGSGDDNSLRLIDLDGNVTKVASGGHYDAEGVAVVDAHTLLSMRHDGTVVGFSDTLQRLPSRDRNYSYGFGVFGLSGLGWDPDLMSFVSWGEDITGPVATYGLYRIDVLGRNKSTLLSFGTDLPSLGATTYLNNEHLIAAILSSPHGFTFYDNHGSPAGNLPVSGAFSSPVTYIAPFDQLAVRVKEGTGVNPGIRILDAKTGVDVKFIDLTEVFPHGAFNGIAYFNPQHPSGGEFLLFRGADNTGTVIDFNGRVIRTFDAAATLGLYYATSVTAMETPIGCGMFAANDLDRNQIVEFFMPCD
jgi:hypothetical protein